MKKWIIKKKYRKLVLGLLILIIFIGAALYRVMIVPLMQQEQWVYKETEVLRGELAVGVTESGILEYTISESKYDLKLDQDQSSDTEDEEEEDETHYYLEIDNIFASVGQKIKTGEKLVSFMPKSIEDVRSYLNRKVSEAEVALAEAKTEYELQVLDTEAEYQRRLIEAGTAADKLEAAHSQTAWDVKDYEIQITVLKEEIDSLNKQWDTAEKNREIIMFSMNALRI